MPFNENLKEAMHINNITTRELSEKTGIKEGTINNYLKTNGSMPPLDKGLILAQALNVSPNFLVDGFQQQNSQDKSKNEIYKYHKYSGTINNLDIMPDRERATIENMISEISKKYADNI